MGNDSSHDMLKEKKESFFKRHKSSNELENDELRLKYVKLRQEAGERKALLHKVSLEREILKVII